MDKIAITDGGLPDVVLHLEGQFLAQAALQKLDVEVMRKAIAPFVRFARAYLRENRPVENFFVDMNHGVMLSNNVRVVVSPGTDPGGQMQDAGDVAVTRGRSQRGLDGVSEGGGELRIV